MSQQKQAYLIMLAADHRFCLGASELAPAAPLTLQPYDERDATLRWEFDQDGLIRAAADPGLCVEVRDVSGGGGLACLGNVMPGKLAQHWRRAGATFINELYPKLVLDNADGRVAAGNPVRVRALAEAQGQEWRLHPASRAGGD